MPGLSVALHAVAVRLYGLACSHIGALSHVFVNGCMYNGFPASDVKSTGAIVNDMRTMTNGVVTRGVLLDLPRVLGLPFLGGDVRLSINALERAEQENGVEVQPGDVLIVHKGRERRVASEGVFDPVEHGVPGLHPECVPWLHSRGVAVLGSDYMNDPQPNWDCKGWPIPIHYLGICGMGMALLHNLQTEALANLCARLHRSSFLLTIAPLNIPGATGSPVNPIAMF